MHNPRFKAIERGVWATCMLSETQDREVIKKGFLEDGKNLDLMVRNKRPSLVFLMETKLKASTTQFLKKKLGNDACFIVDSIGRSDW